MNLVGSGVAVFLGSQRGTDPGYLQAASDLGRLLAEAGAAVVYGGAAIGCMGALADGALAAGGQVIGVMPTRLVEREIAHRGLSEHHEVATMHARKAKMFACSKAFVALPGGWGTLDELCEVVTWRQLGMHQWPIVLIDLGGYWKPLLEQLERAVGAGLMAPGVAQLVHVVDGAPACVGYLLGLAEPPPPAGSWG